MKTFKELGLGQEVLKGLEEMGFLTPTPIQEKAIKHIMQSSVDLVALAQTGTGKTAAFGLPIADKISPENVGPQAIVVCPTRELCLQISQDIRLFSAHKKGLSVVSVYGGDRIDLQIKALRRGANIVVGTPGRVHDLIRRRTLDLNHIKWLVLDEADEMLDKGFKQDLDAILEQTPGTRQTLLFSATMSKNIRAIASKYMKKSIELGAQDVNQGAEKVSHEYYVVLSKDRFEALKRILDYTPGIYGILFCRTRIETQMVADKLKENNYNAEAMHGDISQATRTKIMDRFKKKQIQLLVATDVAARGIDVSCLSHVINYNLPDQDEVYTHRSGRTGRAQESGIAISLIGPRDLRKIRDIENMIGKKFERKSVPDPQEVCRRQIDALIAEISRQETDEEKNSPILEELMSKVAKLTKEDLINYFVKPKFQKILAQADINKNVSLLPAKPDRKKGKDEDYAELRLNLGKQHGLEVKNIFALLNSNRKLKGISVGRVKIMPEFSFLSVEKERCESVLKFLPGASFRGKKIAVSRSSQTFSRPHKKRY